jgi:CheY-like chemotaxis protein
MSGPQTLRALVIDDNAVNGKLAEAILRSYAVRVDHAASGEAGLAMLGERGYDMVLLDVGLPGMGGDQVCAAIRGDARLAGTFVVAYTAHAYEEQKQKFLAAGFDGLLIKPISLTSARRVLRPVLSRAQQLPDWDKTQKLAVLKA